MTLALSIVALAVSTLACWYTRRAALRARQSARHVGRALALAKADGRLPVRYTSGGYVAGPSVLSWLDPEECLLDQELKCIRPSHHPQDDDQ